MNTDNKLIAVAEQLFDRHGFTATGMDRLAQAASISSRTLYKHAGSKTALIAAVLSQRGQRFLLLLSESTVDALFEALERWIREEGARGCLLLRAQGETGGEIAEISAVVLAHKVQLGEKVRLAVRSELGDKGGDELAGQILILIEGATAAAVYRGVEAVASARSAAALLMARARS